MIRVAVAGPRSVLRAGLESLVRGNADLNLVLVAETLDDLTRGQVDVAVSLEDDPVNIAGEDLPPLVLIWPGIDAHGVKAALRAGARAVLPQDCTADELTAAINAAAAGLIAVRVADSEALLLAAPNGTPETMAALSPRELEVLRLLAEGHANKEISYRLGISEHTVKFHVGSILTKLNASTRAEAVAIGIRTGLILL